MSLSIRKPVLGMGVLALGMLALGTLSTFASMPLFADADPGIQAYNKGDFVTAYRTWKAAADRGEIDAAYNLGMLYAKGIRGG